jgi:hypothetical protein
MAFNVFDERDHGICFVVAIVFMPITIFATGLRFWLTRLPGRKVSLEDWFALLALITFLVYASITVWSTEKPLLPFNMRVADRRVSSRYYEREERVQAVLPSHEHRHRHL